MPSALILIADGTEEIEFVTPYDGTISYAQSLHIDELTHRFSVLTRAGFKVKSAGVDLKHDYAE